jgi:hypothetical protein
VAIHDSPYPYLIPIAVSLEIKNEIRYPPAKKEERNAEKNAKIENLR